ncbi:flavodoxin domain-containing protein [Candidatus Xianfuyuplasma coldseepsis]|uniref:Flavodoxin-like domain-containing protein n=1 Tax=Candidatus Xianfuyuplasma coldseepsis TaxID=2782163 RepID=A0A7L7KQ55_9MOLU|nr:flavodoxin domain-containing protein [Xianfuyuplasma coldseepsis]QMS84817.1 hypothetical protein G4Z02_03295 [Xianfuyuplasma coldseepsis]
MKTIILYETRTGFTEECAQNMHKHIPGSVLKDIHEEDYSLEDFDTVLVGAPIYVGEIEHYTSRFFQRKKRKLMDKRLGIFCAGMNTAEFNLAVQTSLPPDIFYHAQIVHCGGKIDYKSLSLKDKFTVRRRLGLKENKEIHNELKVEEFLKWVNEKEAK